MARSRSARQSVGVLYVGGGDRGGGGGLGGGGGVWAMAAISRRCRSCATLTGRGHFVGSGSLAGRIANSRRAEAAWLWAEPGVTRRVELLQGVRKVGSVELVWPEFDRPVVCAALPVGVEPPARQRPSQREANHGGKRATSVPVSTSAKVFNSESVAPLPTHPAKSQS